MSATPLSRCGDAAPYLSALLDGELAEPLQGAVAAHVAGCAACQQKLARLARVDSLLATIPESQPSPDLYDRVLAIAQQRHPERVVRESLRRRTHRLAPRSLPAFLLASGPAVQPRPPARPRSVWLAAALPALAALLIISMTFVMFHRTPASTSTSRITKAGPTPIPPGSAVQQARQAVEKYAAQLAFTPALPTYLPPNAQAPIVNVGPANVGIGSHVLDVVWKWSCAACQVSEVHLRETPISLAQRNDWGIAPAQPALSWQVPGANPWRPGTFQDPTDLGRWAVGQDRDGYSITLDVAAKSGNHDQPSDIEENALRLISLSMDQPYVALTVTPPDLATTLVSFTARSSVTGGITWDAQVAPGNLENVRTTGPAGQYTDISNGTTVLRLDPASRTYATLTASAAADPTFGTDPQQLFLDANTYLSYGELWPLSGNVTFDGKSAERLFLVGAPYATYVYVQTPSLRILGATVDYSSPLRPGGPGASSKLTPAAGCPNFVKIMFRPWTQTQAQSDTFRLTPRKDYRPGAPPPNMTC